MNSVSAITSPAPTAQVHAASGPGKATHKAEVGSNRSQVKFSDAIQKALSNQKAPISSPPSPVRSDSAPNSLFHFLTTSMNTFSQVDVRTNLALQKLPPESRSFIEVQRSINQIQLRAELITKTGESISSSVKKLQQMGG